MKRPIYFLILLAFLAFASLAWWQSSARAQDSEPEQMVTLGQVIFSIRTCR
jgi:hypothetical protein